LSSFFQRNVDDDDTWDGELYRNSCSFVPELGADLIDWLDPVPGERILDVGCGTGELTAKLSHEDCDVVGLDSSPDMIREAREANPQPTYVNESITEYRPSNLFDAVLSNAALHWIQQPDRALRSINQCLKPGGRFIAEMGVRGNVQTIRNALHEELSAIGYNPSELDPWYFPEPETYLGKLQDNDFEITARTCFERPTELYGKEGLELWLVMFAEEFFLPLDESERESIIRTLVDRLRDELYENGQWIVGYRRLRFRALKLD
jgi:trans-aconitate methyltransferase